MKPARLRSITRPKKSLYSVFDVSGHVECSAVRQYIAMKSPGELHVTWTGVGIT